MSTQIVDSNFSFLVSEYPEIYDDCEEMDLSLIDGKYRHTFLHAGFAVEKAFKKFYKRKYTFKMTLGGLFFNYESKERLYSKLESIDLKDYVEYTLIYKHSKAKHGGIEFNNKFDAEELAKNTHKIINCLLYPEINLEYILPNDDEEWVLKQRSPVKIVENPVSRNDLENFFNQKLKENEIIRNNEIAELKKELTSVISDNKSKVSEMVYEKIQNLYLLIIDLENNSLNDIRVEQTILKLIKENHIKLPKSLKDKYKELKSKVSRYEEENEIRDKNIRILIDEALAEIKEYSDEIPNEMKEHLNLIIDKFAEFEKFQKSYEDSLQEMVEKTVNELKKENKNKLTLSVQREINDLNRGFGNQWEYSDYSKINPKAEEYFPYAKAREGQLETVSEILEAIEKGYKYIILEAGTGTGKSAIAATLAHMSKDSYIITRTKQLQNQYYDNFRNLGFELIKGKNNYQCKKYLEENVWENCEMGRCVLENFDCEYKLSLNDLDNCIRNKDSCCQYRYNKAKALKSNVVITNYSYAFTEFTFNDDFTDRELIIFDEAHNIENQIMHFLDLRLPKNDIDEVNFSFSIEDAKSLAKKGYEDWLKFLDEVLTKYTLQISNLRSDINNIKTQLKHFEDEEYLSEEDAHKKDKLKQKEKELGKKVESFSQKSRVFRRVKNLIRLNPLNWVCNFNNDEIKGTYEISFCPIKIDKYADLFFQHGEICIFMSATILDYKNYAKWLGINEDEIYAIRRESPFDTHRNPIKTYENISLNYDNREKNAPKTIPIIEDILKKHENEKGIIHTVNNYFRDYLSDNLDSDRIISHNSYNRERKLKEFEESDEPLVFISPSMDEGVDLPGDKCRFQVIYKIPYPYLEKQVRIRKEIDLGWYHYNTIVRLLQTYGRGMRYQDDYCQTYFIDDTSNLFYWDNMLYNLIPDFFKNAIDIDQKEVIDVSATSSSDESTSPISKGDVAPNPGFFGSEDSLVHSGNYAFNLENHSDALELYDYISNSSLPKNITYYKKMAMLFRNFEDYENELNVIKDYFSDTDVVNEHANKWFVKRLVTLNELHNIPI